MTRELFTLLILVFLIVLSSIVLKKGLNEPLNVRSAISILILWCSILFGIIYLGNVLGKIHNNLPSAFPNKIKLEK